MSEEQVLENMDAEVLETEDEDLLEFKASMGDPSEVPEPSTKKTDEKKKGKGDPMPKLSTKAGMINAAVQAMAKMKKDDLKSAYGKMFSEDLEDDEEVFVEEDAPRALSSITSADIDISEDVDAIFNGSELTEEHKEKIQTVFEAAVVAKVNEEIAKFAVEVESDAEITNTQIVEELTEKVDSYLDYVVQEWVEENKLAIEKGVRADMVEDFMRGLKDLFTEHYVDVPEDKVDVVEELFGKVEELESKLNSQIDENVELLGKVKNFEKEVVFAESTDELTDTQVAKLRSLAEGIEFVSEEDFSKKVSMLKAQYFDIAEETVETVIVDDENDPVAIEEEKQGPTGAMARYTSAISRSAKK
jgi:methyltransferase-like protein